MAMNGILLGEQILAAIDSAVAGSQAASPEQRTAIWHAIGNAIVAHITLTAQVTVTVASVSLVSPGIGVSGPGAGIGVIV
jgi:hypothetical protein